MKKKLATFIAGMVIAQATYAEPASSTMLIRPGGGNMLNDHGNYDINNVSLDKTAIMLDLQKQIGENNKIDRQYLQSVVTSFEDQLKNIVKLKNDFQTISSNSMSTQAGGVTIEVFLNKKNEILQALDTLEVELQTKTSIDKTTLPSQAGVTVGDTQASAVSSGNINMEPVVTKVRGMAEALHGAMSKMAFKLVTQAPDYPKINTPEVNQDALNPTMKFRIFSGKTRDAKLEEVALLQTLDPKIDKASAKWVEKYRTDIILNLIQKYGKDEWLRFENENEKTAFAEMYEDFQIASWMRSFLRTFKSLPLGAMQPKPYDKNILNTEFLFKQPILEALESIPSQRVTVQTDVQAAFENARNWVEFYDQKVTPVFSQTKKEDEVKWLPSFIQKFHLKTTDETKNEKLGQEYASSSAGFFAKADSAMTFFTGQRRTAEILLTVMRLILADIREEKMLLNGDVDGLKIYFNERYSSTEDMKKWSQKNRCKFDNTLVKTNPKLYAKDGPCGILGITSPVKVINNGSVSHLQTFNYIYNQFTGKMQSDLMSAASIQGLLDADTDAGKTDEQRQQEQDEATQFFE